MVTERIQTLEVMLPDKIRGIDEESFVQYERWRNESAWLDLIINPFEEALCKATGYSDVIRPRKQKEDEIKVDSALFMVTTTPTTKKASYKTVFLNFEGYVNYLKEEKDRTNIKGISTIEGELYVNVDLLAEKLEKELEESDPGSGVSQKIVPVEPEGLVSKVPDKLAVAVSRNYAALIESNAREYILSVNMKKKGNELASKFKKSVLEDSLVQIGKLEEPEVMKYSFEKYAFYNQLEPREPLKYEKIVDSFMKEAPDQIKTSSRIGDFEKIRMCANGLSDALKEKGLIGMDFIETYNPTMLNEAAYARLEGIQKKIAEYKKKFTGDSIEQNIIMTV